MENATETNAQQEGQVEKTVRLILSKTLKGQPVLPNPPAEFSYTWDYDKNMGQAKLHTLDAASLDIVLYPLGISGRLAFMSDMKPTPYQIGGKQVIVFRVILNIFPDKAIAAIMFNQDGSTIQASADWAEDDTSYDQTPKQS